jgi:ribosomal protein S18 acetylase RimI-like enzyme
VADIDVAARLLHAFNTEFGEPTPPQPVLARRLGHLLEGGDTTLLVAGDGPDGVAVVRFRSAIWSEGLEGYLAELYVSPEARGRGLGRALLQAAVHLARERGAVTMEIAVDEPDQAARHLYESLGFSNRSGGPNGPLMYLYERELTDGDSLL